MAYSWRGKIRRSLHLLPALRLIWSATSGWTVASVILLLLQGILPIGLLYLTKRIIDTVVDSTTASHRADLFEQLIVLLILMGVFTLVNTFCNSLAELINTEQSQRVTDYMSRIVHAKSIEIDLDYYENSQYFDTLQRAQEEASYRPHSILNHFVLVAQNAISLVAMVGLLLSVHWGLASLLFVAAIPSVLVRIKFAGILYSWHRQRTQMERQASYFSWLLTGDIFAKEIRLFNLGRLFSQRFDSLRQQLHRETIAISKKRFLASLAAQTATSFLLLAAYGFIVYQAFWGILRIGDLVLYYQALQRGQEALRGLLGSVSDLYEDNLFLSNLYEFLDLKPKITQPSHPQPVPRPMKTGIIFDRVSFHYSHSTRQALQDISLSIAPGEVVALVGENGSGKTTLIKLLCRLYEPIEGRITMDGIDLQQLDIIQLRSQISVIFQDYVKYHFTARENIWLGNIQLDPVHDNIIAAARRSGAHHVITSLPQGYNTLLGQLFEKGEELSIGQWQKVALARAFLRDSQIIVLDEPTSALDPKAEFEVFQTFRQLIEDRAAILISHRLSTVKMADRIYVLEKGSIVESGPHEELMDLGGTYAHLFETQAQNYR
jgi:ATP-binding cassette subfamily B protein